VPEPSVNVKIILLLTEANSSRLNINWTHKLYTLNISYKKQQGKAMEEMFSVFCTIKKGGGKLRALLSIIRNKTLPEIL
jgi:hypothetical protein